MLSAYCHSILWLEIHSVGVILQPNLKRNTLRNHPSVYVKSVMFACACMEQLYSLFNLFSQNN